MHRGAARWPCCKVGTWVDFTPYTSDTTQDTERITFHVERRWIEAIRRQADLDGLTITQVVNEAFRRHFEHS